MTDEAANEPDLDEVLAEMRRRVELRRSTGDYPEGLEDDLASHFRRIQGLQGTLVTSEQIDAARAAVRDAVRFDRSRPPAESRVPGTDLAQRAISKAIRADIANLVDQLRAFAAAVSDAIDVLAAAVDDPPRHVHPDVVGSVYAFEERLAGIERRLVAHDDPNEALVARVAELERRLGQLTSSASVSVDNERPLDPESVARIAALVAGHAPVLHIGAGDGALLQALRDQGVAAEGTTGDAAAARELAAGGLVVHHVDALAHLTRLPAGSIGALVVTGQRLDGSRLGELAQLTARRLPPGGLLIIDSWGVGSAPGDVEHAVREAGFALTAPPPSTAATAGLVVATR